MKYLSHALRFLIGGLFIFSGLIKANDPLGLSYKMEEFFELWHTLWLVPFGTTLSTGMNTLEIVAGISLWIGWRPKWTLRLLLLLILFFTALTGYTYYTGYPKTCGCFGDCIPIDSSVSFYKDLALLIGILLLIRKPTAIQPIVGLRSQRSILIAAFFASLGLQFYVLYHLPIVDCLPYRVGMNIIEQRKQPPPPPGSTVRFVYEKNGQEVDFAADAFPSDFNATTYRFVRRYETGEIPQAPIQGLLLFTRDGSDTTEAILSSDRLFLLFTEQLISDPAQWGTAFSDLYKQSQDLSIPVALITNQPDRWNPKMMAAYPNIIVLSCDRTPIRTAARVTPTLYELEKATIRGKWALSDWSANLSFLKPRS